MSRTILDMFSRSYQMSETTRDCWECEVCGHVWLKASEKAPERCANQKCRSYCWNRSRKSVRGRPDKGQVKASNIGRRLCDGTALCACLVCLQAIGETKQRANEAAGERKGVHKSTWGKRLPGRVWGTRKAKERSPDVRGIYENGTDGAELSE